MKKGKNGLIKKIIIFTLAAGLGIGGYFTVAEIIEGDPDADPRYFREVRTDSWSLLIGDDLGIYSVQKKLEDMYGEDAPKVKVDLANNEYSEGNWHYEFAKLAEESISDYDFMAAAGYYSIASFPHLYGDSVAPTMYELALQAFDLALLQKEYPYEKFPITVDGVTIEAYIVFPQSYQAGDSIPSVITTGGIDGLMVFGFSDYIEQWNDKGVAWVGFDMHGHGTSYNLKLTGSNSDLLYYEAVKALKNVEGVDEKNIFIYGRSLGGYAGLRLLASGKADELDVAGIAAAPIGEHLLAPWKLRYTLLTLAKDTRNCWGARVRVNPEDTQAMIENTKDMALSRKSFWGDSDSSIPLLVMNTADDEMNPVKEIMEMATLSTKGEYYIAWDEEGHCPSRATALKELERFIEENLR